MYHSVSYDPVFSTVRPEAFEQQLRYLSEGNYRIVSLLDMISLLGRGESTAGCVSLTFDDGYKDFCVTVFPLLKKYNAHATLFVPTDLLGKQLTTTDKVTRSIITKEEAKELSDSGVVSIMPHSRRHKKLHKLSVEEAMGEIEGSQEAVNEITNKEARIFSYPNGDFTPEIVTLMKASGRWLGAVTVRQGLVQSSVDLFQLPRNVINSQTSINQFRLKIWNGIQVFKRI
jgi:peptidoglycan/xylan/chitin deacetylase (PgdA/CDA1 family)